MRISDTECGAICLLNVTAELHQSFVPVKQTFTLTRFQLESHKMLKGNLARRMYLNQFAHQLYNILFAFVRRLRGFTFSLVALSSRKVHLSAFQERSIQKGQ